MLQTIEPMQIVKLVPTVHLDGTQSDLHCCFYDAWV